MRIFRIIVAVLLAFTFFGSLILGGMKAVPYVVEAFQSAWLCWLIALFSGLAFLGTIYFISLQREGE